MDKAFRIVMRNGCSGEDVYIVVNSKQIALLDFLLDENIITEWEYDVIEEDRFTSLV